MAGSHINTNMLLLDKDLWRSMAGSHININMLLVDKDSDEVWQALTLI